MTQTATDVAAILKPHLLREVRETLTSAIIQARAEHPITTKEIEKHYGVTRAQIHAWRHGGLLDEICVKKGKQLFFRRSDFEAFLLSKKPEAAATDSGSI